MCNFGPAFVCRNRAKNCVFNQTVSVSFEHKLHLDILKLFLECVFGGLRVRFTVTTCESMKGFEC